MIRTPEEARAEAEAEAQEFSELLESSQSDSSGIPPPPQIDVSESILEPNIFDFDLTIEPTAEAFPGVQPPLPQGACCIDGTTCVILSASDCAAEGGIYQGDETVCFPNPCEATCPRAPTHCSATFTATNISFPAFDTTWTAEWDFDFDPTFPFCSIPKTQLHMVTLEDCTPDLPMTGELDLHYDSGLDQWVAIFLIHIADHAVSCGAESFPGTAISATKEGLNNAFNFFGPGGAADFDLIDLAFPDFTGHVNATIS